MKLCIHRGHEIPENCTKCPYHGLSADLKYMAPIVRDQELDGVIDPWILEWIDSKLGAQFYTYAQQVKVPYYLWMQNTMDPNHLKTIHPEFSKMFEGQPYEVSFSQDKTISSYRIKIQKKIIDGFEHILGEKVEPSFCHLTIFPNISMTSFAELFFSIEIPLTNEGGCYVKTAFYKANNAELPKELYKSAIEKNTIILKEDKAICESWAKTYHNHKHISWLPGEERIRVYVELLKQHEPKYHTIDSPLRENPHIS